MPNVDDGATSLEMSLSMLKRASEQGITDVVNTVHFQHPKVETEDISFKRIQGEVDQLQNELDEKGISIRLHSGAEVFFLPNLMDVSHNALATLGHGKYMLIEFQPQHIPESQKQVLFELKMNGVTPIIAHPERYKPVQENLEMVKDWLRAGCLIQVDAGSILGNLGQKAEKAALEIVEKKLCQFIGSDAHDNRRRNFCLTEALDVCKSITDETYINNILSNAKKVIDGDNIQSDFEEETMNGSKSVWSKIRGRLNLG